ncbi:hypothetical protein KY317_03465, partial [Candidatus Woesearchaeota archaeon]|nr:hypothetical protein [Candidatus Woesearchaeota archaeon]
MKKFNVFLILFIFLFSAFVAALGYQLYTQGSLGNFTVDKTTYSCWQDSSSTQGCVVLFNLSINETTYPFNNTLQNLTINISSPDHDDLIRFQFALYNATATSWVSHGENTTIINNTNMTGTLQFRINVTLPFAMTTLVNLNFSINLTNYTILFYLDSINLTAPLNYNITKDQTPQFNFTLYSFNWTKQKCNLTLNDTTYGTNNSVDNGSNTSISASTNIDEGNYSWKIVCNVTGNSPARWIFINDTLDPTLSIAVSNISVNNNSVGTAFVNITADENLSGCDYSGAGSGTLTGSGRNWNATLGDLQPAITYVVFVNCTDRGENNASALFSFTTNESINLTSPPNYNITVNQTLVFNFTLYTNTTKQQCNLTLNGSIYGTNNSVDNGTNTSLSPSTTVDEGNYSWRIVCNVTGSSPARWIYVN